VALAPFASVDLAALRWLRTEESPAAFVLSSGDQPIEEVRWLKSSGSLARAETTQARWTMKRVGFLRAHLTLRAEGAPTDSARVTVHFDPGSSQPERNFHRIEFADGSRFRFRRVGVAPPAWQVTTDDRVDSGARGRSSATDELAEVAHIEPVREGRKLVAGAVVVSDGGRTVGQLPAVLAFVWYAIVLAWFEDEILIPFERVGLDLPARD